MGNCINKLRWKIIRANNLLQFIHQISIEFRFRKHLAQEKFKMDGSLEGKCILNACPDYIMQYATNPIKLD